MDLVHEVVGVDDLLWYDFDADAHVFVPGHWCTKVEGPDVTHHVSSLVGRNGAVDDKFGSRRVSCGCADVARVFNEVAPHS